MNHQFYADLFERDLTKLLDEIKLFHTEENLWKPLPGITNSAGTLTLHLCGNLHHFVGNGIGKNGYIRNRDKEFSERNVPKETLMENITGTKTVVSMVLRNLNEKDWVSGPLVLFLEKNYPPCDLLPQLHAHFSYHLGQVNYLRRILQATSMA